MITKKLLKRVHLFVNYSFVKSCKFIFLSFRMQINQKATIFSLIERKSIYQYIIFKYDIKHNRGKEHN